VQSGGDHVGVGGCDRRELGPCSRAGAAWLKSPLSFDEEERIKTRKEGVDVSPPPNPLAYFPPVRPF
jgi:hypothetical protein